MSSEPQLFYIERKGKREGPHHSDVVFSLLQDGSLQASDLIYDGSRQQWITVEQWVKAREIPPPLPTSAAAPPLDSTEAVSNRWQDNFQALVGIISLGVLGYIILSMLIGWFSGGIRSLKYEVRDIRSSWELRSRGMTALDGRFWAAKVSLEVKNNTGSDIPDSYIKVIFQNSDGIIVGESEETIQEIPAKMGRGPIFFFCATGFKNDLPFLAMIEKPSTLWTYKVLKAARYKGPWKEIATGSVALPEGYKKSEF